MSPAVDARGVRRGAMSHSKLNRGPFIDDGICRPRKAAISAGRCCPGLGKRILRNELATWWGQKIVLLGVFFSLGVVAALCQPCPTTRLAIWAIPNHPKPFLPLHWVASNVHSQGSKSFPRCINALAGLPARGNPVEGAKELTFRDRSSSASAWSSQLPGWKLVVKSRQCPPDPLPTTMQELTAYAIPKHMNVLGRRRWGSRSLDRCSTFSHRGYFRRRAGRAFLFIYF